MRKIINISLPDTLAKHVEKEVKTGKYASKSEFFRMLLRAWIEEELVLEIKQSDKEIQQGKAKILKSLKDLN
jgi:putative addiction module CopG family antidote